MVWRNWDTIVAPDRSWMCWMRVGRCVPSGSRIVPGPGWPERVRRWRGDWRGFAVRVTALLASLLLVATGCTRSEEKIEEPPSAAVETATVQTRTIDQGIEAPGIVAAGDGAGARIAPVAPGRIASLTVHEGDLVRAGQVVATLEPMALPAQSAAVAAARAQDASAAQAATTATLSRFEAAGAIRTARLLLAATKTERDTAVRAARAALALARVEQKRIDAGPRAAEVAAVEATLRQSEATRQRAAIEVDRTAYLFERGLVAQRQLDDARTALTVSEAAVKSAKAEASLLRDGVRAEDREAASLRTRQATLAVAQAVRIGDVRVAQAKAALTQAERGSRQAAEREQEVRAMRETSIQARAADAPAPTTVLRAPISGIVVRRSANPGDLADPESPILEVANPRGQVLQTKIPAREAARVRVGMSARLLDGGRGQVLSVGGVDPESGLCSVRIALSGARRVVGTYATATIVVRRSVGVNAVPVSAVVEGKGGTVVYVVEGGVARRREIAVGGESDGFVEVRRGLMGGETVVTIGVHALSDGAPVTVGETVGKP